VAAGFILAARRRCERQHVRLFQLLNVADAQQHEQHFVRRLPQRDAIEHLERAHLARLTAKPTPRTHVRDQARLELRWQRFAKERGERRRLEHRRPDTAVCCLTKRLHASPISLDYAK